MTKPKSIWQQTQIYQITQSLVHAIQRWRVKFHQRIFVWAMCRLHHRDQRQVIALVPHGPFLSAVLSALAGESSLPPRTSKAPKQWKHRGSGRSAVWHTPATYELKRIWCDTLSLALLAWWNSNPRHFALGARRLVGGRGGEDPPHLGTLLTEDCIESAHRTLNTHRRNGSLLHAHYALHFGLRHLALPSTCCRVTRLCGRA